MSLLRLEFIYSIDPSLLHRRCLARWTVDSSKVPFGACHDHLLDGSTSPHPALQSNCYSSSIEMQSTMADIKGIVSGALPNLQSELHLSCTSQHTVTLLHSVLHSTNRTEPCL